MQSMFPSHDVIIHTAVSGQTSACICSLVMIGISSQSFQPPSDLCLEELPSVPFSLGYSHFEGLCHDFTRIVSVLLII